MDPAPPLGSKLEELIRTVYEDKGIAETYPLEKMYPFLEMLFHDGNRLNSEALLGFLEPGTHKTRKDIPNQNFIYVMVFGLVKIGILVRDIEVSAYMVCHDGVGGQGTYSSCLNLRLGLDSVPLYVQKEDTALDLARLIRMYENFNGRRAVHLKKIERKAEGYVMTHLNIPQDT